MCCYIKVVSTSFQSITYYILEFSFMTCACLGFNNWSPLFLQQQKRAKLHRSINALCQWQQFSNEDLKGRTRMSAASCPPTSPAWWNMNINFIHQFHTISHDVKNQNYDTGRPSLMGSTQINAWLVAGHLWCWLTIYRLKSTSKQVEGMSTPLPARNAWRFQNFLPITLDKAELEGGHPFDKTVHGKQKNTWSSEALPELESFDRSGCFTERASDSFGVAGSPIHAIISVPSRGRANFLFHLGNATGPTGIVMDNIGSDAQVVVLARHRHELFVVNVGREPSTQLVRPLFTSSEGFCERSSIWWDNQRRIQETSKQQAMTIPDDTDIILIQDSHTKASGKLFS